MVSTPDGTPIPTPCNLLTVLTAPAVLETVREVPLSTPVTVLPAASVPEIEAICRMNDVESHEITLPYGDP